MDLLTLFVKKLTTHTDHYYNVPKDKEFVPTDNQYLDMMRLYGLRGMRQVDLALDNQYHPLLG